MTTPRIGVVGTGWWATNAHLPALAANPRAELAAVCDVDGDRARSAAVEFGAGRAVTDVSELAGVCDAVIVATPHHSHHDIAIAALQAGLHVLVEKPLATTGADAWDLVRTARQAGLHLSMGYTYQYADAAHFVRETVAGGETGELVQVSVEFASGTVSLFAAADAGADPADPHVPHPGTYSSANGGGQAHTQITHVIGMVCWATGKEVEEVFAYVDRGALSVDVTDAACFRMRGCGLGVCGSSGMAGAGGARHYVRYLGTRGLVEQDLLAGSAVLATPDGHRIYRGPAAADPAYPTWWVSRDFAELVAGRGPDHAPGWYGAAAASFCEALLQSGSSHRPESVTAAPLPPPAARAGIPPGVATRDAARTGNREN